MGFQTGQRDIIIFVKGVVEQIPQKWKATNPSYRNLDLEMANQDLEMVSVKEKAT